MPLLEPVGATGRGCFKTWFCAPPGRKTNSRGWAKRTPGTGQCRKEPRQRRKNSVFRHFSASFYSHPYRGLAKSARPRL